MLVSISEIFEIEYGNQLDLNKLSQLSTGVSFVNRSAKNLGISTTVELIKGIEPYKSGLITVALGGSVLSSFVQPNDFYTGQNVKVLKPKQKMNDLLKKYYCFAIQKNAFRYSTCGREANSTLDTIKVPTIKSAKDFIKSINIPKDPSSLPAIKDNNMALVDREWRHFCLAKLFQLKKGKRLTKANMIDGTTPFIGSIDSDNGYRQFIGQDPIHEGNTITVNYNGSVAEAFYQPEPFWASDDVNVLYPKFDMSPYIALFIVSIVKLEKYRFSFGRKWHLDRMTESIIKLPISSSGKPDWEFMENYMQSLPYSCNL